MLRPMPLAVLLFVVGGVLAGLRIQQLVPAGLRGHFLDGQDFVLVRPVTDRLEVTEANRLFLPYRYGDFDLHMDVELGDGAELDVLLRQVEPRITGEKQEQMQMFPGRFAALRLSTHGDGPGWRTREQALFERAPGVGLAAGSTATVWITARGRRLEANVAGRRQGVQLADDEYGMTTLLVRGGNAVVHSLEIKTRPQAQAWAWAAGTWGGLGGLGALVVATLVRRRGAVRTAGARSSVAQRLRRGGAVWFCGAAIVVPAAAWWSTNAVRLPLAFPSPAAMAALLAACLVLPLVVLGRWWGVLALAATAAAWVPAQAALRFESPAVDAVFGPDSGAQPSQALAQLLSEPEGPFGSAGLQSLAATRPRVFLLGGQLLYGGGVPTEHLEFQLARELRLARRDRTTVLGLPTVDGHTQQQWRLFEGFYTGYRPEVLVFGVPSDELATDAGGAPRSSVAAVRTTVTAAAAWCRANKARCVLFGKRSLPPALQQLLREFEANGLPLVLVDDDLAPDKQAMLLAAAVVPLLP